MCASLVLAVCLFPLESLVVPSVVKWACLQVMGQLVEVFACLLARDLHPADAWLFWVAKVCRPGATFLWLVQIRPLAQQATCRCAQAAPQLALLAWLLCPRVHLLRNRGLFSSKPAPLGAIAVAVSA
jgi:hypothetical protein